MGTDRKHFHYILPRRKIGKLCLVNCTGDWERLAENLLQCSIKIYCFFQFIQKPGWAFQQRTLTAKPFVSVLNQHTEQDHFTYDTVEVVYWRQEQDLSPLKIYIIYFIQYNLQYLSQVPWLHPEQLLWRPSLLSPSPCLLSSHLPASLDPTSGWDWPDSGTHGYSRTRWQNWTAGQEIVEKKKEQNEMMEILSNVMRALDLKCISRC